MSQGLPSSLFAPLRRPLTLTFALLVAGFVGLSVHVGLLAAGVPFPLPDPPTWAVWLHGAFVAGGLIAVLKLADPVMGDHGLIIRILIAFVILVAVQETFRAALMTGVVTGGWAFSALGLIKPFLRALVLAALGVLAVRWVRGFWYGAVAAVIIAALALGVRHLTNAALAPLQPFIEGLAHEDLYGFPYPFHITAAAYVTFLEALAGTVVLTALVWNRLPTDRYARLATLAVLVALVKGVVGAFLIYSPFTGSSVLEGAFSWSQFLLEFLVLGVLVGLAWEAFGPRRTRAPST